MIRHPTDQMWVIFRVWCSQNGLAAEKKGVELQYSVLRTQGKPASTGDAATMSTVFLIDELTLL